MLFSPPKVIIVWKTCLVAIPKGKKKIATHL